MRRVESSVTTEVKKMSQPKDKRLWSQICDILTYFPFPSPGPFTRDRQKNKKCGESLAEVSALVSCISTYCWCAHGECNSIKLRCTGTTSNVNLAFVSLQSLDS